MYLQRSLTDLDHIDTEPIAGAANRQEQVDLCLLLGCSPSGHMFTPW
jgi:hypothetical protein